MNRSYKIIKLNSGEEIIGEIKGKVNNNYMVDNPMSFKIMTTYDPFGMEREVTYLKPWTLYAKVSIADIKETQVTSILNPTDQVVEMYEKQKVRNDQMKTYNVDDAKDLKDKFKSENIENLLNDIFGGSKNSGDDSIFKFEMNLSKSDFQDLVDKGYIAEDFLDYLFSEDQESPEGFTDDYTGNETDDPNFGNRWTDWGQDPSEYL